MTRYTDVDVEMQKNAMLLLRDLLGVLKKHRELDAEAQLAIVINFAGIICAGVAYANGTELDIWLDLTCEQLRKCAVEAQAA